jgi:hypothetical protein
MDPRDDLDDVEKKTLLTLSGLELQSVASRYAYYAERVKMRN